MRYVNYFHITSITKLIHMKSNLFFRIPFNIQVMRCITMLMLFTSQKNLSK